jgi:DNA-binding transcriptional regulator LsrR (DeoR family)
LRSAIAAAVAEFAVELVGDGRVIGSGRGRSVVAAAVHVVVTHWQDSRF